MKNDDTVDIEEEAVLCEGCGVEVLQSIDEAAKVDDEAYGHHEGNNKIN